MDFSAGGDFPSIAVSINHQHLHHYLTLRTENQLPSFLQNWKELRITKFASDGSWSVRRRWSDQDIWSLGPFGKVVICQLQKHLPFSHLSFSSGALDSLSSLSAFSLLSFTMWWWATSLIDWMNVCILFVFLCLHINVQYDSKDNTAKLKCGPFLLVGSFSLVVWGFWPFEPFMIFWTNILLISAVR